MADPERSPEFDHQNGLEVGNEYHETDTPPKKAGSKEKGRRRTKSGCLTCRKRRIKCGEERPTCQNCTKSKRQCEGYNQRIVFKDPSSALRQSWAGTSQVSFAGRGGSRSTSNANSQQSQIPANPPPIAPKPAGYTNQTVNSAQERIPQATSAAMDSHGQSFPDRNFSYPQSHIPPHSQKASTAPSLDIPQGNTSHAQPPHYDFNSLTKLDTMKPNASSVQLSPLDWSTIQSSMPQQFANEIYHDPARQFAAHSTDPIFPQQQPPKVELHVQHVPQSYSQPYSQDHRQVPVRRQGVAEVRYQKPAPATLPQVELQLPIYQPDLMEDVDDPFDVSDDEDMLMEDLTNPFQDPNDAHLRNNDLGMVVALQASHDNQGLRMRSVRDFIDRPDMLSGYTPSFQTSPFRDPMTARLFCHFVNVTAPIISMFERHPANPSLIFQGQPIPKSQQHIWTYVFPTLALQNSALLHAMLALASLHVSQLQDIPPTKSLKHYHISLRRVAKCLSLSSQRAKPATLAAAMLLSFYECWCADHQKWSNHLLGARHLLSQIEFAKVAKHIKVTKQKEREKERARNVANMRQSGSAFIDDKTRFQSYVEDVDENLVGMLLGARVRYDQYGQILEDVEQDEYEKTVYSEKDIDVYELQRDVYWWYAKQDVYQSLLGGGRLFLQYDLWSRCPPRAPIGRLNATYGTYDHLILLIARVADFASKDLVRKRRAATANGGWRPPQSMGGPPSGAPHGMNGPPPGMSGGPPGMNGGPPPGGPPRMPQMPAFSGMVPTTGQVHLPMGFEEYSVPSPQSTSSGEYDLEAQRAEAEDEWQEIRNMFAILADHFGEDFQPLGQEFSSPIQTPFGPAHQYRTYGIAGIWMNYYMGLIACHRAHPDMPPAAMMAAGFAARQTGSMANELGRVAAGIAPDCSMTTQVSPGVGAGLIESATCLFIAGVQYQDAGQRLWTINRLRDISRLTGWQTATAIATGCETSWVKTAEAGQGPPYTRVTEERAQKDMWANGRRVDRATADRDENNQLVVAKTDRAFYALGILGLENDFENLEVEDVVRDVSPLVPNVKDEAFGMGYQQQQREERW